MGTNNDNSKHRTWAHLGGFFTPDGPPQVSVSEDRDGPLVLVKPFGHCGPQMQVTVDQWRQLTAAGEKALAEYALGRLSGIAL